MVSLSSRLDRLNRYPPQETSKRIRKKEVFPGYHERKTEIYVTSFILWRIKGRWYETSFKGQITDEEFLLGIISRTKSNYNFSSIFAKKQINEIHNK